LIGQSQAGRRGSNNSPERASNSACPTCISVRHALHLRKKFSCGVNAILPVQSRVAKIFPFPDHPNQIHISSHPVPLRGAFRDRHERWVRDAMDTAATKDERCFRGRRSRVVLTPRRWRQVSRKYPRGDGGKKARSPRRARRKPLKPFACGNAGRIPAVTVVTMLVWFLFFPREAAGAAGARHSPRPPGRMVQHNSGASRRGNTEPYPQRHCERQRSNPFLLCAAMDCFADARNDDRKPASGGQGDDCRRNAPVLVR
jgi:hypothetical protein